MNGYKTVVKETESVTVIDRSKFICAVKGIETEAQAKEFIGYVRKKYPLATHYCYAYIADDAGRNRKFSDDGEPHGTAGMPILNVLISRGVYKTVAVVVRYFGGIKLGTGGLSRAYGGAVSSALDGADIREFSDAEFYTLSLSYGGYEKISSALTGAVVSTEYGESVKVKIAVKPSGGQNLIAKISELLGSEVKIVSEGKGYFAFLQGENSR